MSSPHKNSATAREPTTCLIGLGANLGDRAATLERAIELLTATPGVSVMGHSDWLQTSPVGGPEGQEPFLNGAAVIETTLSANECLAKLHAVEAQLGRERRVRWAARTLDVDLLLYGQQHIENDAICVPHPRMAFRPFVLEPAAQVGPELQHPLLDATLSELLQQLNHGADCVVVTGGTPAERSQTVSAIAPLLPGGVSVSSDQDHPQPKLPARPKLQVSLDWPQAALPGIPTLWLNPKAEAASQETEILAALESVWPKTT